jgi:hypothetical protein
VLAAALALHSTPPSSEQPVQMPKSTSVSAGDLGSAGFLGSAEFFAASEGFFVALRVAGLAREAVALPFDAVSARVPRAPALLLDLPALADAFALTASLEPRPLSFAGRVAREPGSWLAFQEPVALPC